MVNHLVGRSAGTPPRARFENLLETFWRNALAEDLDTWNCTKMGHSGPRLSTVSPPYPLHLPSLTRHSRNQEQNPNTDDFQSAIKPA